MLNLRVRSITYEAEGIRSFELVHPQGRELPVFEAGAHIDVSIPGGYTRQYSLCDPPWQRRHYRIAVLEDSAGRGGSAALHRTLRAGDMLAVSEPRNLFALDPIPGPRLLLAGGIGITPLMAMAETLQQRGEDFVLHYCTRSPERTAFRSRLQALAAEGRVFFHHDLGEPGRGLDIAALLARPEPGAQLYFCGPPGFMKAVQAGAAHWQASQVHYEYFGVEPALNARISHGQAGQVRLARSDKVLTLAPGQTLLQAIRDAGVDCASSCEAGVCGTCKVRYFSGRPEHHDFVLSEAERAEYVLVCCAGPGSEALLLDL
ncbi:PDR/VanB family oxidoreductase [Bordetella trematum]|uniref:PDR/VanB family oxidoreductase n=1 Tax=Bordetella trematum TaxID=123899 RepID=UPI003989B196